MKHQIIFQATDDPRARNVITRVRVVDPEMRDLTPDGAKVRAALRRVPGVDTSALVRLDWGFVVRVMSTALWPWVEETQDAVVVAFCEALGWDAQHVGTIFESDPTPSRELSPELYDDED